MRKLAKYRRNCAECRWDLVRPFGIVTPADAEFDARVRAAFPDVAPRPFPVRYRPAS